MTRESAITSLAALSERAQDAALVQNHVIRAFQMAEIVSDMRSALAVPGVLSAIASLQGSAVGFKTDRDSKGGYKESELVDPVIEALCIGLPMTGNRINVLVGRSYVTKEGAGDLLKYRVPGLTDVDICFGIPKVAGEGAVVEADLQWKFNGQAKSKKMQLAVKGQGVDLLIGKATRKARMWLYNTLTGSEITDGEADDVVSRAKDVTPSAPTATVDDVLGTANPAAVPNIFDSLKSVNIPAGLAEDYLRSQGLLPAGKDIVSAPPAVKDGINADPRKFACDVTAWADARANGNLNV